MKKMMITNPDGTKMNVDLVRYFKFRNNCYLIYTIGEFDEKNYQKLYLMKVLEELGVPVIQNIKDETEWKGMQKIVKKVIKELKSKKMIETKDLDYSLIDGIKVSNPRFFKLDQKLVNILSSNYFESELSTSNNEMIDQSVDVNQDQIDNVVPNIDVVPLENQENISENNDIEPINVPKTDEENPVNLESPIENQIPDQIDNVVPNIDVVPIENQENISENNDIEPINIPKIDEENPVNLESSIENQIPGQIDNVVPNINVVPVENQKTVSENIIPEIMPIENNEITQVKLESPMGNQTPDQIDNVVTNIDVAPIENQENLNQTSQIEIKNEEKTIDYKELYLTLKKENDSVNETMETILNELIKYKEKYGEIE